MLSFHHALRVVPSATRSLSMSASLRANNVAVVLSGCGVYDGTEIHEAAACLAALTRHGLQPVICAPDVPMAHVVNHQTGEEEQSERNVMAESARIARGAVKNLSELKANDADIKAVVFPGGFGAAKNLSDFGFKGADMTVSAEAERVLRDFHSAGKPIALCCIAPVLAAKVLGQSHVQLTLGRQGDEAKWPYGGALDAARAFGADVVQKDVGDVCVDEKNKLVTSPAYMYNGQFHEIQDGVAKMIDVLAKMIK